MRFAKGVLTALCVMISILIVSSCDWEPRGVSYDVPLEFWEVNLVPASHDGIPLLRVTIVDSFPWPEPVGDPLQPVRYRITLTRNGEEPIKDVGDLTTDDRVAVILRVPSTLVAQLASDAPEIGQAMEKGERAPDEPVDLFDAILRDNRMDTLSRERAAVAQYQIELVPFAGDRGLLRQEGKGKRTTPPKYTWKKKVEDKDDPCNGKTPEACALEKLQNLWDRICKATKADGSKRFKDECNRLDAMLKKNPIEPVIVCDIDEGKTAGEMDPLTGVITLNGEDFLTSECSDATLLHELQHVADLEAGKKVNMKKLRDAEERAKKAISDGAIAKKAGDKAGVNKAKAAFVQADADIKKSENEAAREKVEDECNAYFFTIDNGDFFDYPGEGNDWMAENVKRMVSELFGIAMVFDPLNYKPMKKALFECYKKIDAWLKIQPKKFQDKFKKKTVVIFNVPTSVAQLLKRLLKLYKC